MGGLGRGTDAAPYPSRPYTYVLPFPSLLFPPFLPLPLPFPTFSSSFPCYALLLACLMRLPATHNDHSHDSNYNIWLNRISYWLHLSYRKLRFFFVRRGYCTDKKKRLHKLVFAYMLVGRRTREISPAPLPALQPSQMR